MHYWVLIEGLGRIVLEEVASHRLHEFDYFDLGALIAKDVRHCEDELWLVQ